MPLIGYLPNDDGKTPILYRGTEENPDGSVNYVEERVLPFTRNRFNNPTGRIIGRNGTTIKYLRRITGCKITVHTKDVRFLKRHAKVTISGSVYEKVKEAVRQVESLIDNRDPRNEGISDFQLATAPEEVPEDFHWAPVTFSLRNLNGPWNPYRTLADNSRIALNAFLGTKAENLFHLPDYELSSGYGVQSAPGNPPFAPRPFLAPTPYPVSYQAPLSLIPMANGAARFFGASCTCTRRF